MNWTIKQREAIDLDGTNIIVSAGAGSGKTAVLSERVIRKLKEGVDIRNILILTFTNEAASEMKERIRKKIKKSGLISQLEYLDAAYITTFDAYALSIVKKYHYLFGLDEDIKIIDSTIIDLEKAKILDEIIDDLFIKKDENYLSLIRDFTSRDDDVIRKYLLKISNTLDLRYDKKEYLENYINNYYKEDYINQIFIEYFNLLKELAEQILDDFYALEGNLDEKCAKKCYDALSFLINPHCYQDLQKEISLPPLRGLSEDDISLKDDFKKLVLKFNQLTMFSEEELKSQVISTKKYCKAIVDIILKLDERIWKYKKDKNSFLFTDIAKMAIFLVKNHFNIREEIKKSYQEIMIDEYQDTNDLQEMFIKEIENNNVYMVGDIKQSIYRFRNANPDIFRNKYNKYQNHEDGKKIDLLENFRSREEVLHNINEIFYLLMIPEIGGVDYQDHHAMVYGNKAYEEKGYTNQNQSLEILKYQSDIKDFSKTEIEAFIIAKDIKEKINNHYLVYDFDLEKTREVTFKDFCIILDRGKAMERYKKIFEYFHIPMEVYQDRNLTDEEDLLILRSIIRLILLIHSNKIDYHVRYSFVSIARSYVGAMSDDKIFEYLENNTFYDTKIYQNALEISRMLDNLTISLVLKKILDSYDFYEKLITVGNIDSALIRLDYLLNLAYAMEEMGYTIADFEKYLEKMIEDGVEIRYKEGKSTGDCVKIMNIHKSKGLEFPICYYAGFTEKFNLKDIQSRFMVHKKYGILTPFYQNGIGTLFIKELIQKEYLEEEIAEKIRLFYVALTRAKEKIIMVVPEFKKNNYIRECVSSLDLKKVRSFYDCISLISGNLSKYARVIPIASLGLTKEYEYAFKKEDSKIYTHELLEFRTLEIDKEIENKMRASKSVLKLISKEEAMKMEYGTKIHEMLEETDIKNVTEPNRYVKNLLNPFDFQNAEIYQELEFIYEENETLFHGIIDLMLEYEDEIKIIDYKLKDIDDEGYIRQMQIYYKYVSEMKDKPITLYLYSIMDNLVKEIPILSSISSST